MIGAPGGQATKAYKGDVKEPHRSTTGDLNAPQPSIVNYALCHKNVSTELGLTFRECSKRSMSAAQGESLQASPST